MIGKCKTFYSSQYIYLNYLFLPEVKMNNCKLKTQEINVFKRKNNSTVKPYGGISEACSPISFIFIPEGKISS